MKFRKFFLTTVCLLLVSAALIPALAGCKEKDPAPADTAVDVRAEALLRGVLAEAGGDFGNPKCYGDEGFADWVGVVYHDISAEKITDGAVVFANGVSADEIAIFRGADATAADGISEALRTHLKERISEFEGYSPEDVEKLKKAELYRDGGFVILLVSDDAGALRTTVSGLLADPSRLPAVKPIEPEKTSEKTSAVSSEPVSDSAVSEASEPSEPSEVPSDSEPVDPDRLVWKYDSAVKEGDAVSADFFHDAIFVGDSRLDDLIEYVGPKVQADYTYTSLSVTGVFSRNLVNGDTIETAIRHGGSFGKCYLMFGFNELGWGTPSAFISGYEKVVALIREVSPNATIYLMNQYPVTGAHSDKSLANPDGLNENNPRIAMYNEMLEEMATRLDLKLINTCDPIVDEHGLLAEADTTDGCHADVAACRRLWEYLKTHTGN